MNPRKHLLPFCICIILAILNLLAVTAKAQDNTPSPVTIVIDNQISAEEILPQIEAFGGWEVDLEYNFDGSRFTASLTPKQKQDYTDHCPEGFNILWHPHFMGLKYGAGSTDGCEMLLMASAIAVRANDLLSGEIPLWVDFYQEDIARVEAEVAPVFGNYAILAELQNQDPLFSLFLREHSPLKWDQLVDSVSQRVIARLAPTGSFSDRIERLLMLAQTTMPEEVMVLEITQEFKAPDGGPYRFVVFQDSNEFLGMALLSPLEEQWGFLYWGRFMNSSECTSPRVEVDEKLDIFVVLNCPNGAVRLDLATSNDVKDATPIEK